VELIARARPDPARERCPYCRDELAADAAAAPEDLVECPGCGASHHSACLEELGRCSVMGCTGGGGAGAPAPPAGGPGRPVPARLREARERIRARARAFAREHARPRPELSLLEARVRAALEGLREAERERRWADALEFLRDLRELTPEERDAVRGAPEPGALEARTERLEAQRDGERLARRVIAVLALLTLLGLAGLWALLLQLL
jgi:hypothetical protein